MAGTRRGPMHGIPYALKDIIETAGIRTTGHSKLRQDHVPTADAEIVAAAEGRRRRLAGQARDLGIRARRPELGLAVAAGAEPVGHRAAARRLVERRRGGGGGGVCARRGRHRYRRLGARTGGVLRPRRDQAELRPGQPPRRLPQHLLDGPLRPVVPQRRGRRAVPAGHRRVRPRRPRQRGCAGAGLRGRAERRGQGAAPRPDRGLAPRRGAHPDLAPAIDAAVEVLRGLGAEIEPVKLSSLRDYTDCKTTISSVELYAIHEHDLRTRPQDFGRILRNRVLPGALIRAEDYLEALRWRTALAREQAARCRRSMRSSPPARSNVADRADPNQPDRLVTAPSITMPFSVAGMPAMVDPVRLQPRRGPAAVVADRRRAVRRSAGAAHRARLPAGDRLAPPPPDPRLRSRPMSDNDAAPISAICRRDPGRNPRAAAPRRPRPARGADAAIHRGVAELRGDGPPHPAQPRPTPRSRRTASARPAFSEPASARRLLVAVMTRTHVR